MAITKTSASLLINSQSLTPAEISAFIGMQPDMHQTKCKNIISGGKEISSISKHNLWCLRSRSEKLKSYQFHINNILQRVAPYEEKIATLAKDNCISFECVVFSTDGRPYLPLDNETLRKIARLGLCK